MKSQDIRQSFLDFFATRNHRLVGSAPIITHGDPTLLFTNAGMVPFKEFFLGSETPPSPRAVSAQKCLRVSGKHNDLENVGPSPRHHTFFEMLGNFSFGDYFKEDAIRFAWELVTQVWGLDPAVLYATVYEEDDEALALWRSISGLPADRVLRCGAKDNFWSMGETGPCGPCSEIFVDRFPDRPPEAWETGSENGRYLEIWNLVFMQYERDASGVMTPLPNPSIDTGAGLERVAAVLQGVDSNYDTDLFQPILHAAADLASVRYGEDPSIDTSLRVIADHLRAASFLLSDCVIPGPDGRGYVLRRLIRRAVRHGLRIGFEEPFLHRLVPTLVDVLGTFYTELQTSAQGTIVTIREEEEKYLTTRASGARRVQAAIDAARATGATQLDGKTLFDLYETHGQEIETVREIAEEEQLGVDVAGFEAEAARQRDRSRVVTEAHQKRQASLRIALCSGQATALGATPFDGYDALRADGVTVLRAALREGEVASAAEVLAEGANGVVALDRSVFYAEGGGQVGDHGTLTGPQGQARVVDTQKDAAGTVFHFVHITEGQLAAGDVVTLAVDTDRRRAIERNHTATHLLHAALRQVLGEGVRQAGSMVAPERLRFDFSHNQPISPDQLMAIEDVVNHWVREAVPVAIAVQDREAAQARGAMALFGEKYGDEVRTVEIAGFSLELCGGCHVRNSGEIGLGLIVGERGIASGIRRVEMVTGAGALALVRERQQLLLGLEHALGVPADRANAKVDDLQTKVKALEKDLSKLRMQLISGAAGGPSDEAIEVSGVKVIAREVPSAPVPELRAMADKLRDQQGSGIVILGSPQGDDKVTLIVTVSKDLLGTIKAGDLVKALAPIVDGRGGGRPDFAQAGGKAPSKLGALLDAVPDAVASLMG